MKQFERNELSMQEVAFYRVVVALNVWTTAQALAEQAGIAPRTGRAYALKFVRLGLMDEVRVWPAHRYRWSTLGAQRNRAYLQRLERGTEIFGKFTLAERKRK